MTVSALAPAPTMRVPGRISGRDNNFNLIRMVAASGVMVSHAFPLSLGRGAAEPFDGVFAGANLGRICVFVFFAVSGFYITQSFLTRRSLGAFLMARVLRLYPALVVTLLVTAIVLGLFITTAPPDVYWRQVPGFLLRRLTFVGGSGGLPGVFADNPAPNAINGSLWTLFFEVLCYLGVVGLGLAGLLTRRRFGAVIAVCLVCYAVDHVHPLRFVVHYLMYLGLPFLIGMAFRIWQDRLVLSPWVALLLALLAAVLRLGFPPAFEAALVLAVAYTTFVLGFMPGRWLQRYNRLGDYSYGMYIYAFPVQQTVAHFLSPMTPLANLAMAFPVTLVCAVLSWHLIEKPALSLKSGKAAAGPGPSAPQPASSAADPQ